MYAVDDRIAPPRLTDDQLEPLVVEARTGDSDAFETIVRTLQGPVRAFARRLMRDEHLGDDAAQESFVRMWRGLGAYEIQGRFVAWAFTITRNTCIELLRKQSRAPLPLEVVPDDRGHDPYEATDLRRAVREAIDSLDEPYRSTFLLREAGLAYEEIAGTLSCPVGTVRSRLHEAKRILAGRLARFLGGD